MKVNFINFDRYLSITILKYKKTSFFYRLVKFCMKSKIHGDGKDGGDVTKYVSAGVINWAPA